MVGMRGPADGEGALDAALAARLRDATNAAARERRIRPVLLIDGRAGAGKTTLACAVAAAWPAAALVHLEDVYPGWDGLDAASAAVAEEILGPPSAHTSWDWTASA